MENMITGYQYGDDLRYIGPYQFPDNKDQESVHLPPRTTLIAPPEVTSPEEAAFFDVDTGSWVINAYEDPIAKLKADHAAAMQRAEDERLAALRLEAERMELLRLAALEQAAAETQAQQPPVTEAENVTAS